VFLGIKNILLILVVTLNFGCSTRKGFFEGVKEEEGVGIVKFNVINSDGENITENCSVGYGENGISPNLQLYKKESHVFTFKNKIKVEYIHCLINLRLRRFNFKDFKISANKNKIYNLGEYFFKYDYEADYTETEVYKRTQKAYKDGKITDYPPHNLSEGKMYLVSHKEFSFSSFETKYPNHNKEKVVINDLLPQNLSK